MSFVTPGSAIRVIAICVRDDHDLGARAMAIWRERTDLDPDQCVALAREERQKGKQRHDAEMTVDFVRSANRPGAFPGEQDE